MISLNATLIIQIINFIFLMWFLNKFLFKPMLKVLDERKKRVEDDFSKAKELQERVEKGLEEYRAELEKAKQEGASIRLKAREEATAFLNKEIEKAKEEANAYIEKFKKEIEESKAKLKSQLESEIEDIARALCSTLLGREIQK